MKYRLRYTVAGCVISGCTRSSFAHQQVGTCKSLKVLEDAAAAQAFAEGECPLTRPENGTCMLSAPNCYADSLMRRSSCRTSLTWSSRYTWLTRPHHSSWSTSCSDWTGPSCPGRRHSPSLSCSSLSRDDHSSARWRRSDCAPVRVRRLVHGPQMQISSN